MNFEEEVLANKKLRQEIDAKIQQVKELPASKERSLCITKLPSSIKGVLGTTWTKISNKFQYYLGSIN